MARKPTKAAPVEDPEQSRAFLKLVADLEAAGELDPIAGEEAFAKLSDELLPPAKPEKHEDS
jgi:hypothetical protein